jgi:hypothetical protein
MGDIAKNLKLDTLNREFLNFRGNCKSDESSRKLSEVYYYYYYYYIKKKVKIDDLTKS